MARLKIFEFVAAISSCTKSCVRRTCRASEIDVVMCCLEPVRLVRVLCVLISSFLLFFLRVVSICLFVITCIGFVRYYLYW